MSTDFNHLPQGDLRLLDSELAQQLLASNLPARMAYVAKDATPRIVPTWFHWTGDELVMPTFSSAPHVQREAARVSALRARPDVAVTIDTDQFPPHVLHIRGKVSLQTIDGIAPEYRLSARKYMGDEAAEAYLNSIDVPGTRMVRIAVRPEWVGLLDFEGRMPGPMTA